MFDWLFKEISLPAHELSRLPEERGLWYESPAEREQRWRLEHWKNQILPQLLRIARDRLTPSQYQVLALFLSGKSQREIALILGLSRSTVKSRWSLLLRKLKKYTAHLAY
jgi:RNA polymerase sigma factor (sigma-70 family)